MPNSYRGEVDVPGLGTLRYDWNRIAELIDALGSDFDAKISQAAMDNDVRVMAQAAAIGAGVSVEEVMQASPPIVPTFQAIIAALNLAFHGKKEAKKKPATRNRSATR